MTLLAGIRREFQSDQHDEAVWQLLARQHPVSGAGASGIARVAGRMALGVTGQDGSIATDGRICAVVDARLDHSAALRRELGLASDSDGATLILGAWQRWGERTPQLLYGDFAFALWDSADERLILVRDALGQRPLFFRPDGSAFASRADAFDVLDPRHGRPAEAGLTSYLASASIGSASHYQGVERVRAGESVEIAGGQVTRRRWWNPPTAPDDRRSSAETLAQCRKLLEAAVGAHVAASRGPIATHLSAGLDSSVVTALAARAKPVGEILHAFTAVPAAIPAGTSVYADEGDQAALAASALPDVRHHRIQPLENPLEHLFGAHDLYQEPLPNPHNHGWSAAINDAARDAGSRSLLIGQAGNLSFSMGGRLQHWAKRAVQSALATLRPKVPVFPLLAPQAARAFEQEQVPAANSERRLYMLREMDPGAFLKGMALHWGLAVSDPLSDRKLVEFSLTIPDRTLIQLGDRGLGRPIAAQLLPHAFVYHRPRGYQSVDWIDRLRRHAPAVRALVERTRDHDILRRLLDLDAVAAAVARLESADPGKPADTRLYRIDLPRALAAMAFVHSLAEQPSHPGATAWRGARL